MIVDRMFEPWRMPPDQRTEESDLKQKTEALGVYGVKAAAVNASPGRC